MPDMNGVEFLSIFKQRQPDAARIILSAYTDHDELIDAINKSEIYRFIMKPRDSSELKLTIAQALAYQGLLIENQRLADTVRNQKETIVEQQEIVDKQQEMLNFLEKENPGITKVDLDDNGFYVVPTQPN